MTRVRDAFLGALGAGALGAGLMIMAFPALVRWFLRRALKPVLSGKVKQNAFYETLTYLRNTDPAMVLGIMRRAETGKPFSRPYGTTRRFDSFDELMFIPAQLGRLPAPDAKSADTRVTIGPRAQRPLQLQTPILVSGVATGLALSLEAKVAIARGASAAGTATNSGEGGYWPEERRAARHYVLQVNRGGWVRPEEMQRADMLEIQFGQAADIAAAKTVKGSHVSARMRQILGIGQTGQRTIHTRFDRVRRPADLRHWVDELRDLTGGVPIALKFAAGDIEADLEFAMESQPDCIVIDGAEGATHSSLEVTIQDCGLPLLYAIPRADAYLRRHGAREAVTLIAAGGLRYSGDFLKAMALGADAVYSATSIWTAMIQDQLIHALPYLAPPLQLFFHEGKLTRYFDLAKGAKHVANFIRASTAEMATVAQALGHTALDQVDKDALYALSREVAEATGVRLAYASALEPIGPDVPRPRPEVAENHEPRLH